MKLTLSTLFRKALWVLILIMFPVLQVSAQVRVITGTVIDAEKEPLVGANVFVKGKPATGTSTDINGKFTLEVEANATLVVSYVGYLTKQVLVNNQLELTIVLDVDRSLLDEVVVVGYGVQSRSDLTGSVASVTGKEVNELPVVSIDQALQGRAAGVFVTTPSGTPGAGININVRGNNSLSGSGQPLYVIDGIPMISEDLSGLFSGGQATNSMADINPADIESIEILKDASATAIYGSRGANGVVMITTKRGKAGQSKFDVNFYRGTQDVTRKIDMMSSNEYLALMDEAALNDDADLGTSYGSGYVSGIWGYNPAATNLPNTRWYDEIFRTAPITSFDISGSGGAGNTRYYSSVSYFNQEGVQIGTGFERISGRLNLDTDINRWFKMGTSVGVSRTIQDRTINDNSLYGVVINTLAGDPLMPVYEDDGSYADPFNYFGWWMLDNPVLIANEYFRQTRTVRGLATFFGEATLAKGLTFKSSFSVDYTQLDDESYTPRISRESSNGNYDGFGTFGTTQDFTWLVDNYLNYSATFGDKHVFNGVLGSSYQASDRDFSSIQAQGYPSDQFVKTSVAAKVTAASSSGTQWGLASFFIRGNYTFDNKYLVTFTGRYDGSSRFGSNNRYGFFPSGSLAWRISEEDFMKGQKIISDLKPRVSYGITGNQDGIGNFASRGLFGVGAYRQVPALVPTQLTNANLSWESTRQLNIGLDLGLLDNRFEFTADYFISNTDDILQNSIVPGISGFGRVTQNIGSLQNRGLELSLRSNYINGDFRWTSSFNISFIRNEITKLDVDQEVLNDSHILAEGNPIGTFFLIDQNGVDPNTGNIKWVDLNNDGVINSADRRIVGNAQPDYFGGWNNTFNYKGFDLSILLQFTVGNEIFNHSRASYENLGYSRLDPGDFPLPDGNNWSGASKRWKKPGDKTDIPRASLSGVNWREYSSRWLEDGSFLRVKNINFGYTVPKSYLNRVGVSNLRVFLQLQNWITFTKYTGFDPEVNQNARNPLVSGSDFGTYPQTRSVTAGLNLQF